MVSLRAILQGLCIIMTCVRSVYTLAINLHAANEFAWWAHLRHDALHFHRIVVSFFLKDSLQEGTQILLLYSKAASACVPVLVGQCVVLQHTPSSGDHDMI